MGLCSISSRALSSSGGAGRPVWLSLQLQVREMRKTCRKWKQGCAGWEEYRGAVCVCRDRIRKAKVQMELNLVRDVKKNKKEFYRYGGRRRQAKESIPFAE